MMLSVDAGQRASLAEGSDQRIGSDDAAPCEVCLDQRLGHVFRSAYGQRDGSKEPIRQA